MSFRAGLIGYGTGGRVFHAPLLKAAGIELAAVASSKRGQIARDFPGATVCETPETLLADNSLDLVIVSTPSHTHGQVAIQALQGGHNVVVDKPFAGSVSEADEIIAAAEASGTVLSVFQNRRWDCDFLTIADLLERDVLGHVHEYRAHFEFHKPDAGESWKNTDLPAVGIQFDLGTHLIDQALQLFGIPDWVSGDLAKQRAGSQVSDHLFARLGYDDRRVTLTASMMNADHSDRFVVHGAKGSYRKSHMDGQEAQLKAGMGATDPKFGVEPADRYGTLTLVEGDTLKEQIWPSLNGCHHMFYRKVREAIESGGVPPVTAAQARDGLRVIEALMQSDREGRRIFL